MTPWLVGLLWGVLAVSFAAEPGDLPTTPPSTTRVNNSIKQAAQRGQIELELERVVVTGNQHISSALIAAEVFIRPGDVVTSFIADRIKRRVTRLRYFSDVTTALTKGDAGVVLTIAVVENPQITTITFMGNEIVSDNALAAVIKSRTGDVLNLDIMRQDVRAIEAVYHDKGYDYAKVYDIDKPTSANGTLVFQVGEGIIEEIILTGNAKTKDYVILRELTLKPGMALSKDGVRRDLRRIHNLNFFNTVEPNLKPTDKPNSYNLIFAVDERPPGSLNIGGGYSDASGMFFFTDVSVNNFLGTGQSIMARTQLGDDILNYELRYHNPWMWYPRRSLTARLWHRRGLLDIFQAESIRATRTGQSSTGGDIAIGIPITYDLRTSHRAKFERVDINTEDQTSSLRDYSIQSYTFGISYDKRDIRHNPREGYFTGLTVEKGLDLESQSLNFEKYNLRLKKFFPTFEKQTIATRLEIAALQGEESDLLLQTIGYTIGGQNTVRGYDDFFAQGRYRIVTSIEYRWMLNHVFQWLLFADAGTATQPVDSDGNVDGPDHSIFNLSKWRVGKGIGVRINSPLGPLRLDFGNDDEGQWNIHFSLGHAF